MKLTPHSLLAIYLLLFVGINALAAESEYECHGYSTIIYSNKSVAVSVCHGPHTKINLKQLGSWQSCVDSIIYTRNQTYGKNAIHTDCSPITHKEFKVVSNTLSIKHYYDEYPGFELVPFIIEEHNIESSQKTYKITANIKKYTKDEIDKSVAIVERTINLPFDGNTYFDAVYGGFFKLRSYSITDASYSLDLLSKFNDSGKFDGEVSETLSSVIDDVKLIKLSVDSINGK